MLWDALCFLRFVTDDTFVHFRGGAVAWWRGGVVVRLVRLVRLAWIARLAGGLRVLFGAAVVVRGGADGGDVAGGCGYVDVWGVPVRYDVRLQRSPCRRDCACPAHEKTPATAGVGGRFS